MNKPGVATWMMLPLGLLGVAFMLRAPGACAFGADDKPAPPAVPAPPPAPAAPPTAAPAGPPGPGGMAWVQTDGAQIGTPVETVMALGGQRKKEILPRFVFETPVHKVDLKGYFVDIYEVTNAQYKVFLDEKHKTTYKTGTSALSNLQDIAGQFVYGNPENEQAKKDNVSWRQLFWLNQAALEAAMPALKGKTEEFRYAALPPDVVLVVYTRRIPDHWTTGVPPEGEDAHPVRLVSYSDAESFAEWAGKHILTEDEWEWAARGPEMREYPWGNDWVDKIGSDKRRVVEDRCNWGGLGKINKANEPSTVAVDEMPEGRSWCGCYHMLGNVAEWTSSTFNRYPGAMIPSDNPYTYLEGEATGDVVKVIRGASLGDLEKLVLRLAARNFEGTGRDGRPFEGNRFKFVGFRCGSYFTPALDRMEPAIARVVRLKRIKSEDLDRKHFKGTAATHFTPSGEPAKNHVYVTGGSASLFYVPKTSIYPDNERAPARTPNEILDRTTGENPVMLGIFHTDIRLSKMVVPTGEAPGGKPEKVGTPRRAGAKPPPSAEPATKDGLVEPGSYVLGLWHHKIGLFQANLDLVGFFGIGKPGMDAKVLKKEDRPAPSAEADPDADLVTCGFWIPTGGKGTPPEEGVRISWAMYPEAGALAKYGSWR